MTHPNALTLHRTLGLFMAEVEKHAGLQAEMVRARREFFGVDRVEFDPLQQAAADARFVEWYLIERDSELLGEPPLRKLARGLPRTPDGCAELQGSSVGVFVVEATADVVRLRDLQDQRMLDMSPVLAELNIGDLVVGRLYPHGEGDWIASAAVAVQEAGRDLAEAFRRDLMALDLGRRLTQVEIEHLMFRRWREIALQAEAQVPLEHLEARLEAVLRAGGMTEPPTEEISAVLREAESPGRVMGPLLDEVAFETDVDLEQFRVLLLEMWNAYHATPKPATEIVIPRNQPAQDHVEGLGRMLASRIEAGMERHEDIEKVFEDVAEMLGEDVFEQESPEEVGDRVILEQGDLEPLIQEFLWEEQCEGGHEETLLALLLEQQKDAPVPRLDLEFMDAQDLLRLLLRIYLQAAPVQRRDEVEKAFEVLQRFFRWAENTQQYALGKVLAECRTGFIDGLDRLHRASLALSTRAAPAADSTDRPTLVRVEGVRSEAVEVVPCDDGEPLAVVSPAPLDDLRSGDLILGILRRESASTGELAGMVVVLPAAAEVLLG